MWYNFLLMNDDPEFATYIPVKANDFFSAKIGVVKKVEEIGDAIMYDRVVCVMEETGLVVYSNSLLGKYKINKPASKMLRTMNRIMDISAEALDILLGKEQNS